MGKCKKLKEYLERRLSEYEFSKVQAFLTDCCGLKYKLGGKNHHVFSPLGLEDVQITFADDHKKRKKVKKCYVKDMWRDLDRLGIEPLED